jgi:hypothetical protein
VCNLPHHDDCWEENVYHCGRFACDGTGLVDRSSPVRLESTKASQSTVVVSDQEIPDATPYQSREQQEASFVGKLQQQAAQALLGGIIRRAIMEEVEKEEHARQEEQRRQKLAKRVWGALGVGLILGIMMAVAVFQHSRDWILALFTVYLIATGIANAAGQSAEASDRASSLYWLLPRAAAAAVAYVSFTRWGNGLLAVILGYIVGIFLIDRILRIRTLYENRAFITYSVFALTIWGTVRFVVFAPLIGR